MLTQNKRKKVNKDNFSPNNNNLQHYNNYLHFNACQYRQLPAMQHHARWNPGAAPGFWESRPAVGQKKIGVGPFFVQIIELGW